MNNNSIQIDRYLQHEMGAEEVVAFEAQLLTDAALQQELNVQQQIIRAATNAGLKLEFAKAIKKKIAAKKILRWSIIVGTVILVTAIVLHTIKYVSVQNREANNAEEQLGEKFTIDNATDTIIETKDGVVLAIPAHAFNTSNSSVELQIKTALNAYNIMHNGLSTMSNGAMLKTTGMFYINGYVDGKEVSLAKEIAVSIPTDSINNSMQLFDGVKDSNGLINWVNPKPIDKSLRTYDINTLDFYPPDYIPALKALQKDYQNKIYTDSLYYSFSRYREPKDVLYNQDMGEKSDFPSEENSDSTKKGVPSDSPAQSKLELLRDKYYQIDPAIIHSIWDKKFNNTFVATKEFEERLRYMHSLCTGKYLNIYLKNLSKPLYVADSLCAKLSHSSDFKSASNKFDEFAARHDGGVMIASGMQQKLSNYFQAKYKAYKDAAVKTQVKYQKQLDSLNTIADTRQRQQALNDFARENKNFTEEFAINITDAYRQIEQTHNSWPPAKKYYNLTITTTGWKNLDQFVFDATVNQKSMSYTDPVSAKTATLTYADININIENMQQFDKVLLYLIPDRLSSFQRIEKEGNTFKEALNALFKYDAVAIAYKGTQAFYFKQDNAQPKTYDFNLLPITDDLLRKSLNVYSINKETPLSGEMDYQLFEQNETMRKVLLQKDMEFRSKISTAIFHCAAPPQPALVVDSARTVYK